MTPPIQHVTINLASKKLRSSTLTPHFHLPRVRTVLTPLGPPLEMPKVSKMERSGEECPPSSRLGALGKHRKLLPAGSGQITGWKRFWYIFSSKTHMIATNCCHVPCPLCTGVTEWLGPLDIPSYLNAKYVDATGPYRDTWRSLKRTIKQLVKNRCNSAQLGTFATRDHADAHYWHSYDSLIFMTSMLRTLQLAWYF